MEERKIDKEYIFTIQNSKFKNLGTISIVSKQLPSHKEIVSLAKKVYGENANYYKLNKL